MPTDIHCCYTRLWGMSIDGHCREKVDCAICLPMAIAGDRRLYEMSSDGHCRPQQIAYELSIDNHPAIYASQSSILETRPKLYCGWRWLLLDTITRFSRLTIAFPMIMVFFYGTQQVAKNVSGMPCSVCLRLGEPTLSCCGDYISALTLLSLRKTFNIDVARNSRTRR